MDMHIENNIYRNKAESVKGMEFYESFLIIETEEYGKAVVSKKNFKKGQVVFDFSDGEILNYQTQHTLQIVEGKYIDHPIAGYVKHSCDPNCWVIPDTQQFVCRLDIKVGDFISMDYEQTEDVLFTPFDCNCGSPACRGHISGRKVTNQL